MKRALMIASAVMLTACGPEATQPLRTEPVAEVQSAARFDVTRVGVFEDSIAYNSRRGIYVIIDKKTGREFVGVSGVGIADIGSHPVGKTTSRDER